jgi:hypothetical protein
MGMVRRTECTIGTRTRGELTSQYMLLLRSKWIPLVEDNRRLIKGVISEGRKIYVIYVLLIIIWRIVPRVDGPSSQNHF